jgi:type IV pilus assembly protein PilB
MPSISPEISLKVTNLLKTMGKLSDPMIAEAKKKYDGNGKAPLGILHYLIDSSDFKKLCIKKNSIN